MGPLLAAAGAEPAGFKRVPDVEAARGAAPGIGRGGLPLTDRTADPALAKVELVEDFLVRCDDEGEERHPPDRVTQWCDRSQSDLGS